MQAEAIDSQQPVIHLEKLTKQFGHDDTAFFALNEIDLDIEKGEFVAIMGPSGSGKTTLLNILGLLDTATEGEYQLDGTPVADIGHRRRAHIRSTQVGFVFQNFNLLYRLSVIENVALPLTYRGHGRTYRLQTASEMLKTFHLQEREYYMPHQLSGGQLQRVAIARALVTQPAIILADEPTGNLDSKSSEIIMSELSDIHQRGNTIIMVTHNPELTVHATRVIQMVDGKVASDTKHPAAEPDPSEKRPLGTFVPYDTEHDSTLTADSLTHEPGSFAEAREEPEPAEEALKPEPVVRQIEIHQDEPIEHEYPDEQPIVKKKHNKKATKKTKESKT